MSHFAILRAMRRFGINDELQEYIENTLTGAYSNVTVGGQTTKKIYLRNGVKQGDPLSPVLFNIVPDELICQLNDEQPGATMSPACKIACLAFADDILLLEDTCAYDNMRLLRG